MTNTVPRPCIRHAGSSMTGDINRCWGSELDVCSQKKYCHDKSFILLNRNHGRITRCPASEEFSSFRRFIDSHHDPFILRSRPPEHSHLFLLGPSFCSFCRMASFHTSSRLFRFYRNSSKTCANRPGSSGVRNGSVSPHHQAASSSP